MATQIHDVTRWTKEQRAEFKSTPYDREVLRALVDHRFTAQERRKAVGNQISAIERATDTSVDIMAIRVAKADFAMIETKMDAAIKSMVENHRAGRWAVSIPGIAHTFAGVLLAYVEIHPWVCMGQRKNKHVVKCPEAEPCTTECHKGYVNTSGKLWRFAGLDPTTEWKRGERRPYCAQLKTLAWQIGESFKKLGTRTDCLYASLYRERKAQEIKRNEAGMFAAQALERLEKAKANKWGISALQRETWAAGKLQPIGLDIRAGRYAAKMFLSHFHHVLHEVEEGCPPPAPYAIGISGHADYIAPPGWPCE